MTATPNPTPMRSSAATDGAASWSSPSPSWRGRARWSDPARTLVALDFPGSEVSLRFGGLMTVVVGGRDADDEWVAAAHAVGQEEPPHEFLAPARSLSSILDEVRAPEVDLLALDVEGYEAQALAGLDLERHAPRFVLVEMRDPEVDRVVIEEVLGERYMDVDALSPFDILYARVDVADAAGLSDRARR
jgi:hypothetical protein